MLWKIQLKAKFSRGLTFDIGDFKNGHKPNSSAERG